MSDDEGIICLICSDNCLNNYIKYPLTNGSCKCVYYIHQECQTIMNNEWGKKCPICSKIKNNTGNSTEVIVEVTENLGPMTDIVILNENILNENISNENILQGTDNFRHDTEDSQIYCKNCCIIFMILLFVVGFITIVCTVSKL